LFFWGWLEEILKEVDFFRFDDALQFYFFVQYVHQREFFVYHLQAAPEIYSLVCLIGFACSSCSSIFGQVKTAACGRS